MKFQILNIEIPPTVNCNANQIIITSAQITNSKYKIGVLGNRAQIKFQLRIELFANQQSDVDCLMKLPESVNCECFLAEVMSGISNKIKAQLSFDGTDYILTALI